jgi:large subunit ribosomal protein L3
MAGILGTKLGMTRVFTEEGRQVAVTVIKAGPCPVTQVKTTDTDGYEAIQIAWDQVEPRKISNPERGHLAAAKVDGAFRTLHEVRGPVTRAIGDVVTVDDFADVARVKVTGIGKGKGFQGGIKRHNFSRGPKTHGSHNYRAPGSIGASATPSRVFKGKRMPGQMGARQVTQVGLRLFAVEPGEHLLLIHGAVPGPNGATVFVQDWRS